MSDEVDAGAAAPASEPTVADTGTIESTPLPPEQATVPDLPRENGKFADRASEPLDTKLHRTLAQKWNELNPLPEAPEEATGEEDTEGASPEKKETKKSEVQSPDKEKETPAAKPVSDAPLSWTGDMKAKWASLPPEFGDLQEYAAKRDREQNEAINRAGQQVKGYEQALKSYEPIRSVFERHAESIRRNGLHPAEYANRMFTVEEWLGRDAPAAINEIAKAYKVDLKELAAQYAAPVEGQQEVPRDPRFPILERQLSESRAQLAQVMSYLTAQQKNAIAHQQAVRASQEAALDRYITDFAKDKPHFETVRQHMGTLMALDQNLSPEAAYQKAIRADDNIFNAMLAEQRKKDDAARTEAARKKATDAQNAARVNTRSSTVSGQTPKTIDDTLRETAKRLYA